MTELEKIIRSVRLETVQSRHLLKLINDLSGDATDAIEIIDCWLAEVPDLAEKMLSALDTGDQQTLKHSAHTIKSAARSVGAMALGDLAERLQYEGTQSGDKDSDLSLVRHHINATVKDLNALLNALTADHRAKK